MGIYKVAAVTDLWKNHRVRPGKNIPKGEDAGLFKAWARAMAAIAAAEAGRMARNSTKKEYEMKRGECVELGQELTNARAETKKANQALQQCFENCPSEIRTTNHG